MSDFLRGKRQKPRQLAEMVRGLEPILAPGAYDALSARMIENAQGVSLPLTLLYAAFTLEAFSMVEEVRLLSTC